MNPGNALEGVKILSALFDVIPAKAGIQASSRGEPGPILYTGPDFHRESWTPVFTGVTGLKHILHGF
jgi:hypothetical protein